MKGLKGLLRGKYAGFGPTLAAEKLAEIEGIAISRESIRRLQIAFGLWKPKSRKARRAFLLRERGQGSASSFRSTAGLRGHSSLHAAVDVQILAERLPDGYSSALTFQKSKDATTDARRPAHRRGIPRLA